MECYVVDHTKRYSSNFKTLEFNIFPLVDETFEYDVSN